MIRVTALEVSVHPLDHVSIVIHVYSADGSLGVVLLCHNDCKVSASVLPVVVYLCQDQSAQLVIVVDG